LTKEIKVDLLTTSRWSIFDVIFGFRWRTRWR